MCGAPSTRRPAFFWMVLALGAAVLAAEPLVVHALLAHGGPLLYRGWRSREDGSAQRITYVDPHGPAADALVPGDLVLAIDDDTRVVPDVLGHFQDRRERRAYAGETGQGMSWGAASPGAKPDSCDDPRAVASIDPAIRIPGRVAEGQ